MFLTPIITKVHTLPPSNQAVSVPVTDAALVRVATAPAPSSASALSLGGMTAWLSKPLYGSITYAQAGLAVGALAVVTKLAKVW